MIDRYGQRVSAVPGGLLFALGLRAVRDRAGRDAGVRDASSCRRRS